MIDQKTTNPKAPGPRIYHRAKGIREDGAVSALCFTSPRAINMKVATWTIRDEAVTCPRCLEIIGQSKRDPS
ncbi:MAG TPA: hypothetical protein VGV37_06505 [Aliidongia sp.]|uniref:hypothetical protein n=1 Tax=Aliidongia sp. TaxID=1914230 RepID=UPI002DDCFA93|nr:hypothetical protein [Aliidongia sp.]HEV2674177.1 hypothetical protein [Aliidongia sp.]